MTVQFKFSRHALDETQKIRSSYAGLTVEISHHNFALANLAPSAIALNFSQITVGWTSVL